MSKRKAEDAQSDKMATAEKVAQNDYTIGLVDPVKDYQKLIETRVQVDEIVDDDVTKENFDRTAAAARDVIWRLLFDEAGTSQSNTEKASQLLEEYRGDACFYDPTPYNEWIVKLRDEVLKKELLDFWRDVLVKKQLGPCWSRDCDLFDSDDTPPLEFYAHAGCTAPFAASLKVRAALEEQASLDQDGPATPTTPGELSADDAAALSGEFEAALTKENPLEEYRTLMKRFVLTKIIVPDSVHQASVKKIAAAAREIIWKLLFDGTPSAEDQKQAADLLQEYKGDAGFYGPDDYNSWIYKLRDEVLTKELLDFWRDKMVKMELGPSCARDSDYYDNEDPLPFEFYDKAGCKAPFEAPVNDD
ncbi:GD24044 [Drosophila simulans]|uniref:GD24044 n=1 Tax=Drosophila simulans TaxID=7240 RepID=B4Q6Y7_DROSI|nr:GD24044 [Drosophila simulans]